MDLFKMRIQKIKKGGPILFDHAVGSGAGPYDDIVFGFKVIQTCGRETLTRILRSPSGGLVSAFRVGPNIAARIAEQDWFRYDG